MRKVENREKGKLDVNKVKQKIRLVIASCLCLLTMLFGFYAASLYDTREAINTNSVVEENNDENVSTADVSVDGTRISIYGAMVEDATNASDLYAKLSTDKNASGTITTFENRIIAMTNTYISVKDKNILGNLTGSTVVLSNCIFEYTGAEKNARLFDGTPAYMEITNCVFYTSQEGASVSADNIYTLNDGSAPSDANIFTRAFYNINRKKVKISGRKKIKVFFYGK